MDTVYICSPRGRDDGLCECYACRLRRVDKQLSATKAELAELRKQVARMRRHQKEYFATKSPAALAEAKAAEAVIDGMIDDQPRLFK